jgi:hypothetical protein
MNLDQITIAKMKLRQITTIILFNKMQIKMMILKKKKWVYSLKSQKEYHVIYSIVG